ncbi:hypothetical protein NE619_18270, partial [Anaerovorax odorimutans]
SRKLLSYTISEPARVLSTQIINIGAGFGGMLNLFQRLQPHIPGFRAVLAPLSLPDTLQPHNFPQQIAQIAADVVEKNQIPLFYISPAGFLLS